MTISINSKRSLDELAHQDLGLVPFGKTAVARNVLSRLLLGGCVFGAGRLTDRCANGVLPFLCGARAPLILILLRGFQATEYEGDIRSGDCSANDSDRRLRKWDCCAMKYARLNDIGCTGEMPLAPPCGKMHQVLSSSQDREAAMVFDDEDSSRLTATGFAGDEFKIRNRADEHSTNKTKRVRMV
jgi:hypothetical protein